MIRARWIGAVACALGLAGAGWGQSMTPERVVSVKEAGKPAQKCRVLRCWTEKDGSRLCQVQAVDTGEMMTIMDPSDAPPPAGAAAPAAGQGSSLRSLTSRVFRWGKGDEPPAGVPA